MNQHSRKSTPQASAFQQLMRSLRALLIVWAAWNGPLPWCHAHGTLGNGAGPQQEFLRDHLRSHHGLVDPFCDVFFCWHLHVDFPPSDGDPESGENHLPPRHLSTAVGDPGLAGIVRIAAAAEALHSNLNRPSADYLAIQPERENSVEHFFDGFAPKLAVPLRFGVIRC